MEKFTLNLLWAKAQMLLTALGGWLGFFLGGADGLFIALLIFMGLDYLTGVLCALQGKKLCSAAGFRGITKKLLILFLVGAANLLDQHVISSGSALRGMIIVFYLSNEGISLLENASRLGLPIPERLKSALIQLHRREEAPAPDTKEEKPDE